MYSFVSVLALFLVGCGGNTPVDTATCSSGLLYAGSSGVGDGVVLKDSLTTEAEGKPTYQVSSATGR